MGFPSSTHDRWARPSSTRRLETPSAGILVPQMAHFGMTDARSAGSYFGRVISGRNGRTSRNSIDFARLFLIRPLVCPVGTGRIDHSRAAQSSDLFRPSLGGRRITERRRFSWPFRPFRPVPTDFCHNVSGSRRGGSSDEAERTMGS